MHNKTKHELQVLYNGKWVDKSLFRAFVYSKDQIKVADNWAEYESYLSQGTWFKSQEDADKFLADEQEKQSKPVKKNKVSKERKLTHDSDS